MTRGGAGPGELPPGGMVSGPVPAPGTARGLPPGPGADLAPACWLPRKRPSGLRWGAGAAWHQVRATPLAPPQASPFEEAKQQGTCSDAGALFRICLLHRISASLATLLCSLYTPVIE